MRLTKNDMARVIVAGLYNMSELPTKDHPKVVRRAVRGELDSLRAEHKLAVKAIESRNQ